MEYLKINIYDIYLDIIYL